MLAVKAEAYKSPIGTKKDPMNNGGMRISGVPFPPRFSASYVQALNSVWNRRYLQSTHMSVDIVCKFGSCYGGEEKSYSNAEVGEAGDPRIEAICFSEEC